MNDTTRRRELSRLIGACAGYEVHADALNYSVTYANRNVGHYRTLAGALRAIVQHATRRGVETPDLTAVAASVERIVSGALDACQRIADGANGTRACAECRGAGQVQVGTGHADSDGGEAWYVDDCEACAGTGIAGEGMP